MSSHVSPLYIVVQTSASAAGGELAGTTVCVWSTKLERLTAATTYRADDDTRGGRSPATVFPTVGVARLAIEQSCEWWRRAAIFSPGLHLLESYDMVPLEQTVGLISGRVHCSRCGAIVSSPVPDNTVLRAFVECVACLEKDVANVGKDLLG